MALVLVILVGLPFLPCCFWPKRGTRSRAALTGYRWGFTPLAILPLGVILWMFGRMIFGTTSYSSMGEAIGIFYGLIGLGISVVVGLIAAIVCGVRWKRPTTDKCERCGYSLVGLTGDKCPECGHTVSTTATA